MLIAALVLAGIGGSAVAQDNAAREREALVRAQRAVNKLQQENAALAREKGALAAKLETVGKELAEVKGEATRARGRAAVTEKELVPLRAEHDALKQKLEATEKQLTETSTQCKAAEQLAQQTQKRMEAERMATEEKLKQESAALQNCTATNRKLHDLARDLAQRYEKAAAGGADPIFGLRRVEIENEMQDYRDRVDESRFNPARR